MSSINLEVPQAEQTLETGRSVYRYHIEHSEYDADKSLEDLHEYRQFRDRLDDKGRFMISETVTHAIADATDPTLQEVQYDHRNDDHVVEDAEGLSKFVAGLESAREALASEGGIEDVRDRKIERCVNIVRFAMEHGYGIYYG